MSTRRWLAVGTIIAATGSLLVALDAANEARSDVQLRAMSDELARSKNLSLNNLDKPYFIAYTISDSREIYLNASLGGITAANDVHLRHPRLEVRVGDYKLDNTNSVFAGERQVGLFPIDDDYQAMRADLWLSTDALYKASTDEITRKRSALRDLADPEQTPDFAFTKPIQLMQPVAPLKFDQAHWEQTIQKLSSAFIAHPNLVDAAVRMRVISSTYRLVNTEGTIVRIPQDLSEIQITANAFAPDGRRVWNHEFITFLEPSEMPGESDLTKTANEVAADTDALAAAPAAQEYTGPVLFEQEAAAEMMAQVLTDAIRLQRKPVAPLGSENRGSVMVESVWSSRIGSKVLPDWLSLVDDPMQSRFESKTLAGHYEVDDEGVLAERVTLVDKGTLKTFLMSRTPVRTFVLSNGHGRVPGPYGSEAAAIGNLFVQASETVSESALRKKMLEQVKAAGLPFGILIRRLDFPSTASFQELQSMARQLQKNGYSRTLNSPLLAYRVYPDGHEELVRGFRFKEFSAKDLRDIDAASDRPYVLNYLNNGSSFNLANAPAAATTSSVICPSLLLDSVELTHDDDEPGRLPIVPAPALTAVQ